MIQLAYQKIIGGTLNSGQVVFILLQISKLLPYIPLQKVLSDLGLAVPEPDCPWVGEFQLGKFKAIASQSHRHIVAAFLGDFKWRFPNLAYSLILSFSGVILSELYQKLCLVAKLMSKNMHRKETDGFKISHILQSGTGAIKLVVNSDQTAYDQSNYNM